MLTVLFLLGVTAQAASGIALHHLGPGWTPRSVRLYYRGEEGARFTAADPFGTEGSDAQPPEAPAPGGTLHVPRSLGTLLELAHFHLVAMPIILFVVAHFFSMTRAGRQQRADVLCYGSFLFAALDITMPFAIRYVSGGFGWVKLLAFAGLLGSLLVMTLWTLAATLRTFSRGGRLSSLDDPGPRHGFPV